MDFSEKTLIKKTRLNVNLKEDIDIVLAGLTTSDVPLLSGCSSKYSSKVHEGITVILFTLTLVILYMLFLTFNLAYYTRSNVPIMM